jgi:hypothetical protein
MGHSGSREQAHAARHTRAGVEASSTPDRIVKHTRSDRTCILYSYVPVRFLDAETRFGLDFF